MAYTKLLVRRSNLSALVDYVKNEAKTTLKADLLETLDYAMDEEKTRRGEVKFVSGINCFPEDAAERMIVTKKEWNKTGGRLAYHLIQSFAPGENVTPELAHEIGRQYAERLLPGYEVVVSTHLDRDHTHNHIVFNSVCMVSGEKFHLAKPEFYEKIRGISDALCREHGLPVIEFEYGDKMTYKEWLERGAGGKTWKEIIQSDVETVLHDARSMGEFMAALEDRGYEVDTSGKYAKVRPYEKERFVRLNTIGFSDAAIERQISLNRGQPVPPASIGRVYYKKRTFRHPRHTLTRFEAQYLRYMFLLGKIKRNPKRAPIPPEEYRKFNEYKAQFKYLAENQIANVRDLSERESNLKAEEKELAEEKFRLRGAKAKLAPLFAAQVEYNRYRGTVADFIKDGLEHEAVERWQQAEAVLKKAGYDTPDKIAGLSAKRILLLDNTSENSRKLVEVRQELKTIGKIKTGNKKVREGIKKEQERQEVRKTWKQRQSESRSRVER